LDAVLTERGADRRRGVGRTRGHLELDESRDLLSHVPLVSLELRVVELHRGRPSEQADLHLDLALVVIDFLHRTGEVREWPFHDLHDLTRPERNLLTSLRLLLDRSQTQDLVDLVIVKRLWLRARTHELDHALDVVDHVHRALARHHLYEHVARIEPARHRHALAVLDLHHVLGRDERLLDPLLFRGLSRLLGDPDVDQLLDLVLVTRIGLYRVPAGPGSHAAHQVKML